MYIPKANEENRLPVLHDFLRTHPLASLVTMGPAGMIASHIPLVLAEDGSEFGLLQGHISRANTQWKELDTAIDALAIFSGDHHYITPSWYPMKQETGKVVPTWNYCVVHAYGPIRLIEDAAWLTAHLETLTNLHESPYPTPWKMADAPPEFIATLLQRHHRARDSHPPPGRQVEAEPEPQRQDRAGVAQGLAALDTTASLAMQRLVEEALIYPARIGPLGYSYLF